MNDDLKPGVEVRMRASFLKSIMTPPTSESWRMVGRVLEVGPRWVRVAWGDGRETNILPQCLEPTGWFGYDDGAAGIRYEQVYGMNGYSAEPDFPAPEEDDRRRGEG